MQWRLVAALVALLAVGALAQAEYFVGVGIRDVSPSQQQLDDGEVWLGGYGFWKFRGKPTGVHDPVWARAMAVSDNETTVIMTVLDFPGITNRALKEMREGVEAATGVPVANVLISCTHTHSGPDMQGLWGYVSDGYRRQVIDLTVEAMLEAYNTRVPARLRLSSGEGTAKNRRDWGYTDTELIVLDAINAQTSARIGTLVNFAAHPVTLGSSNLEVSSDWCHYLREHMEESLGAPVLYFNGVIGDVSPGGEGSQFERAENYGTQIGDIALAAMSSQVELTLDARGIVVDTIDYNQPVTNPAFRLAFLVGMLDYDIEEDLSLNTRASYVRLASELQGVAFPGESLTNNGLAIKEAMTSKTKLFLGLNGDTIGYFVPTDEWFTGRNDNYEEMISVNKYAGDTARDILVGAIEADN